MDIMNEWIGWTNDEWDWSSMTLHPCVRARALVHHSSSPVLLAIAACFATLMPSASCSVAPPYLCVGLELCVVGGVVDASGTSTGVGTRGEALVPVHGTLGGAGDGLSTWHGLFGGVAWEEILEDHAVAVTFLGGWGVVWESVLGAGEHLIGDLLLGDVSQMVNPSVSDTVTELFLLSPQDIVWKVWIVWGVECLTDGPLLDLGVLLGDGWSL
eukprot:CAMPEP_0198132864 /NCGR_PEP_ID=MMETSP1442-20131203/59267_1 /TAXON_ID= /ORGANISM="Craspedostauros australis, Strain CCMP3328" /LENGTH=212 /DNA_ID=CAMNT_0043793965 /DNA_START=359 /DNA_END=994 /DNA_ORIENTATION=-